MCTFFLVVAFHDARFLSGLYHRFSYIVQLMDGSGAKAADYFNRYMAAVDSAPVGDGTYPFHKNYWGGDLLTDNPSTFMSSFIPQFCWFQTRYFGSSPYYQRLFAAWLKADMKFWQLALPASSEIWGKAVAGRTFGAGVGPAPSGYHVDRIGGSSDLVVSAAIMAGFLGAADSPSLRQQINDMLSWLYDNEVYAYTLALPDGRAPKVLWC